MQSVCTRTLRSSICLYIYLMKNADKQKLNHFQASFETKQKKLFFFFCSLIG